MNVFKQAAREGFRAAGGIAWIRYRNRRGVRILMYHRFSGPHARTALERQCAHLRDHYLPVSLGEAARFASEARPAANRLAVTVDDGYRDFYTIAYPVFRQYGIPVTVFLTTGFLDGQCWMWPDQVLWLFSNARVCQPEISLNGHLIRFMLDSPEAKRKASNEVKSVAKRLPDIQRLHLLASLPEALGVELPSAIPRNYEPLRWDEVRELRRGGIEFGAHTVTHPILSKLSSPAEIRHEIEASRRRIEAELDEPVAHFCYPNGLFDDFEPLAADIVHRAGFEAAVTAEPGLNFAGTDRFRLRRIPVTPEQPDWLFERYTAGFRLNF